jgi:hypothetical protein
VRERERGYLEREGEREREQVLAKCVEPKRL